jgi:hypothetical protein
MALDILTAPLSEILAAAKLVDPTIIRNQRRMESNKIRARVVRKQKQDTIQMLLATGSDFRIGPQCEGGEPDTNAPIGPVECAKDPRTERDSAIFDGRYVENCECQRQERFRWTGKPYLVRPYRFLASDFSNNFGGLDTNHSVRGSTYLPARVKAERIFGDATITDPSAPGRQRDNVFLPKRLLDDRQQNWSSDRDSDDGKPYRGPSHEEMLAKSKRDWEEEVRYVNLKRQHPELC